MLKRGQPIGQSQRGLLAARDGHCHPGDPTVSFLLIPSKFFPERYIQEGLHQYLEIEPPRAMLQIEQVVTQATKHLIDRVRIPIVERGVRGHPPDGSGRGNDNGDHAP